LNKEAFFIFGIVLKPTTMGLFDFFSKGKKEQLDKGLEKTKESVLSKLSRAIAGKSRIDDDVLDNLEEALIMSDVGVETTVKIIERIQDRVARDKYMGTDELNTILKEEIVNLLEDNSSVYNNKVTYGDNKKPYVIIGSTTNQQRQKGLPWCCRHLPCCCNRTAYGLGQSLKIYHYKTTNGF
jgi:signal recognition particle GTPase